MNNSQPETRNSQPVTHDLKDFLDQKHDQYNTPKFIKSDPIQIPHHFSKPEDIEIIGFLTATIAWGLRKTIIKNALQLADFMDNSPYDFIMNATDSDFKPFADFKHRTFNGTDCLYFIKSLQNTYKKHGGLQHIFTEAYQKTNDLKQAIIHFRKVFFELDAPDRTYKHVADVSKKSAAKRLNLFLMWMIRNDNRGVHFGLWKDIPTSALYLPLDVHTANVGRKLGLLTRKQNDWQAVEEITKSLRQFDPKDPIKYDFALFGLGVFEGF